MKAFKYTAASGVNAATKRLKKGALLKAGGSDLLDRMKERLVTPDEIVSLNEEAGPKLREIEGLGEELRIGALATLAEVAASDKVARNAPALVEAANHAASPQIRHRATIGGNICQQTRCGYFRLASFPCWKRGDDTCPVLADGAVQDTAGIFGNTQCASAHPASLPPVLGALGAKLIVRGRKDRDHLDFADLWRAPEKGVHEDVALDAGEVIAAVILPKWGDETTQAYEEVRQKAAFDWALVSCAVRVTRGKDGKVASAGIWLGSVAPTPHHAAAAEKAIVGTTLADGDIAKAANAAVTGATPLPGNAHKVELVKVVVRRALRRAAGR